MSQNTFKTCVLQHPCLVTRDISSITIKVRKHDMQNPRPLSNISSFFLHWTTYSKVYGLWPNVYNFRCVLQFLRNKDILTNIRHFRGGKQLYLRIHASSRTLCPSSMEKIAYRGRHHNWGGQVCLRTRWKERRSHYFRTEPVSVHPKASSCSTLAVCFAWLKYFS